jgi:hypothetical protein
MKSALFALLLALAPLQALPAFAQSDEDLCEILTDEARMANEETPLMVDDYTREDNTIVSCADKKLETKMTAVTASLPADWRDQRQNELNSLYCGDDLTADSMEEGWTFTQTIAMPDGSSVALKAACE